VLHARKLAFARLRIGFEEIIRDHQTQNRIAEELKRFVVQIPGVVRESRRHLFVRPGTMRHRLGQQIMIAESIADHFFQGVRFFEDGCFHLDDSSKTPNAASK